MTTPKRHHFIPRLHLQHFVGPEPKGQVWAYDALTGQVRSAVPEQTAFERHFYSVEGADGSMNTAIETKLAETESKAAPIYEALLRGNIPDETKERADFAVFLALIYLRTPAMRRMSAEAISRHLQIMGYAYATFEGAFDSLVRRAEREGGPVFDEERREQVRKGLLDPSGYVVEVPRERTLQALGAADELAPLLFRMRWSLAFAAHGFFITSDNPMVRQVDRKTWHPVYGDHGFLNKTAEVTLPLSPKVMLLLSWNEDAASVGELPRIGVDAANRARAAHSDRYLYAHIRHKQLEQLAAEFKDSRPRMTTQGFGPEKFAETRLSRRSRRN